MRQAQTKNGQNHPTQPTAVNRLLASTIHLQSCERYCVRSDQFSFPRRIDGRDGASRGGVGTCRCVSPRRPSGLGPLGCGGLPARRHEHGRMRRRAHVEGERQSPDVLALPGRKSHEKACSPPRPVPPASPSPSLTPPAAPETKLRRRPRSASHQGLARLDDFFAREIAAKRVPGAVVAIARDGGLGALQGLLASSTRSRARRCRSMRCFALASMTKPMAAVAGLTLMEQGKLPLQAGVADYYPAFADMKVGVQQADGSLDDGAAGAPDLHPRSLSPHLRPDVWRPARQFERAGRGFIPTARRRRSRATPRPSSTASPSCRWCISPAPSSNTASRSTCSAPWSRSVAASGSATISRPMSGRRSA